MNSYHGCAATVATPCKYPICVIPCRSRLLDLGPFASRTGRLLRRCPERFSSAISGSAARLDLQPGQVTRLSPGVRRNSPPQRSQYLSSTDSPTTFAPLIKFISHLSIGNKFAQKQKSPGCRFARPRARYSYDDLFRLCNCDRCSYCSRPLASEPACRKYPSSYPDLSTSPFRTIMLKRPVK